MEDDTAPRAPNGPPDSDGGTMLKRGPGRPPKPTPDNTMVRVHLRRGYTSAAGKKQKGTMYECALREARKLVDQKIARWDDPHPEVQ